MQIEQKNNSIVIFSRTETNARNIQTISDFPQYFYCDEIEEIIKSDKIVSISETQKKTIFGKSIKKITVRNPYDIVQLRNMFRQTYEADIPVVWRYYIDQIKEIPRENLRKFYLDIETADMPDTHLDNQPITCIGIYDNYTDYYYTFIIDEAVSDYTLEQREKHSIYRCKTEYILLDKFVRFVDEMDPDMIIAHNGDKFDFPVIVGRLIRLQVLGYGKMSPLGIVKRDNAFGDWKTKVAGRIMFDFLGAKTGFGIKGGIRGLLNGRDITVKDANGDEKIVRIKRWSLGYLAQFVHMQKGDYSGVETIDEMIKYNKLDVSIMLELDKFFNVTEYYHNMQILIGCPFEATYFNTNMIDFFLMKRFPQYVFPTKPARGKFDGDETIKGADVTVTKRGLYKILRVVDQTSLYPSVVVSWNMSPETLDPNGDIIVGNGVRFSSARMGMIPEAIQFLLDIRLKYKKLAKNEPDSYKAQMYDLLSNGYKTLLVSFYGALLYKGFRLYQHDVAECIPYMGRVIKVDHVKPICEANGYEIVAGDTDSSFLNTVREDATDIDTLIEIINKSFDKFTADRGIKKHILNIELDKVYSPIIMSDVKKRYVGYLIKKGKKIYKVTGFESVRRDTAPVTELMQETVFKMVLDGKLREQVDAFIEDLKEKCISGKIPLSFLMLPKGFSKVFGAYKNANLWMKGVEYSNKYLGTHFDHFSEIGAFHIKGVPEGKEFTDVLCVDEDTMNILDGYTIDWKEQLDKTIISKYDNIKEMLNWQDTKQRTWNDY